MIRTISLPERRRRTSAAVAAGTALLAVLAGCGSSTPVTSSPGSGSVSTSAYDAVIDGAPVANPSSIAAGSWMEAIKQRGYLQVGGTDSGQLFSLKDPTTGELKGFDAGLSQMLAHYITGKTDVQGLTKLRSPRSIHARPCFRTTASTRSSRPTRSRPPGPRKLPSPARTTNPVTRSWSRKATARSTR